MNTKYPYIGPNLRMFNANVFSLVLNNNIRKVITSRISTNNAEAINIKLALV